MARILTRNQGQLGRHMRHLVAGVFGHVMIQLNVQSLLPLSKTALENAALLRDPLIFLTLDGTAPDRRQLESHVCFATSAL